MTTLLWDHGKQQANDLCKQTQTMTGDLFAKNMSPFVIPVATLAARTKSVFVKPRAVFTCVAGIAFGQVGTYGTNRPIKLIR